MNKGHEVAMIGGSKIIDLNIKKSSLDILINGPGMLFSHMEIITNLRLENGYTFANAQNFAAKFHITAQCGHIGEQMIKMEVSPSMTQPKITLGIGPMGMYQNKITIHSRDGETFDTLIKESFSENLKSENVFFFLNLIESDGQHHHGQHKLDLVVNEENDHSSHSHHQ